MPARAPSNGPAHPALSALLAAVLAVCASGTPVAHAQDPNDLIRNAREAFVRKDKPRLAGLRATAVDTRHPLAPWVDYWDLTLRLNEARADEVESFYARWPGSFHEDRLRNDWLLELGRRRDWPAFSREMPRFKMNDDREVTCYGLLTQFQAGKDVADAARRAWAAQRDADEGCQLLAQTLYDAKQFSNDDIWRRIRQAVEHNRPRAARAAANIIGDFVPKALGEVLDSPARYLALKATAIGHHRSELTSVAIGRMASTDVEAAARLLDERWGTTLGGEHGAWAWALVAKHGALGLRPESWAWSRRAWDILKKRQAEHPDWSDEILGWHARAALRLAPGAERWHDLLRSIDAMSATERTDPTWQYWRARAVLALAKPGEAGDPQRLEAHQALSGLAGQLHFYGQLAAEDLGTPQALPSRPAPPSPSEREATRKHPGLQRALLALDAGLRSEAVREWNFSLIGMGDRDLLAAAQWACEREVWDRCINTSDRSRTEIDMEQRFPMPLRTDVLAKAKAINLDPAYVYGLIRQESRFVMDARSSVGASGLMQVMPATARWTAKKIGLADFRPEQLAERDTNLRIGTAYLKLVLDDLGGSQPMAAAAYNAGPGRPRRWREGPVLESAIWIENMPIHETRDYVKKVISNATYYAGLLAARPASIKARLGITIGPREATAPAPNSELP